MKRLLGVAICVVLCFHLLSCSQTGGKDKQPNAGYSPPSDLPSFDFDLPDDFELNFKDATFVVTYSARLVKNNSVGNDWERGLKYNGETISSGSRITQEANDGLSLTAFAIEYDSWNDRGSTNITFDCLEVGEKKTKQVSVIVRENKGRYTGNTAKWTFDITVERIS